MGNGLGLTWNDPTKLLRSAERDTWTIDLKFNASLDGYGCSECLHNQALPANSRFEFRILTSDFGDMVGPNFGLLLHITSKMEVDFPPRVFSCFPYFFTKDVSIHRTSVISANPIIQTRDWAYYLPASFNENPYKTYPALIVPDLDAKNMERFRIQYDQILYESAVAEETILIGTGDYRVENSLYGRTILLTPTPGIQWYVFFSTVLSSFMSGVIISSETVVLL